MSISRFRQGGLVAAAVASMIALAAHAGEVSPGLQAEIAAAAPGKPVPVIVTLADRIDPAAYRVAGRQARDGRLVQALREKAAATQGPLKGFLASRAPGRVTELWAINGLAIVVPPALVDEIAQYPGVDSVRLDALATAPSGDAGAASAPAWNLDTVNAPQVWLQGYRGEGMVVANMDTGVDPLHPDLASRWRGGTNSWYDPNGQHATPYDADGHGTQTMSIAVGGDAGGTSIGVAPGARWIAAKLYDDAGYSTYSKIHLAFQWLLDPDGNPATRDEPDVVNASWGLLGTAGRCITEFEPDIALLRSAGIAVAFAAGNDGPQDASSLSPANNPSAFSVGAVDASLAIASFSARGPSACTGGTYPTIVAPGVNVTAADLSFGGLPSYAVLSGTSFAAPHVAGAMALLMQAVRAASVADIESAITSSAVPLGSAGADNAFGNGLLDIGAAFVLLGGVSSPLSIASSPVTTATVGVAYAYQVTASSASGTTFSLDVAPAGMTVDAQAGLIAWTPTSAQVGTQAVTVRATNTSNQTATQSYTVSVGSPLSITSSPVTTATEDVTYSYQVTASPASGTTFSLDVAPAGMNVGSGSGRVTWVPTNAQVGTNAVAVRVTNTRGEAVTQSFAIAVANVNDAPVAVADSATAPKRASGNASYVPVVIAVLANDSDPDGNLNPSSVAIVSAPGKGGTATVNANGTVSYVPKANFRGTESFKYRIRDLLGAQSNTATVTVRVQ